MQKLQSHMPELRIADASDARQLAVLAERTFRATFEAMNTPEDMNLHCEAHYSETLQRREILDPAMQTLVCQESGQLLGFANSAQVPAPSVSARSSLRSFSVSMFPKSGTAAGLRRISSPRLSGSLRLVALIRSGWVSGSAILAPSRSTGSADSQTWGNRRSSWGLILNVTS